MFAYDWRKDLNVSSLEFKEFVEKIHSENGGKPVYVIARKVYSLYPTYLERREDSFLCDLIRFNG